MEIEIKLCRKEDVELLGSLIPRPSFHVNRFESQEKGDSEYLIAWLDGVPVGHLNLMLKGSDEAYIKDRTKDCPELNAIGTYPPEMRSKGIGTKLIAKAEDICRQKGFKKVGLAVDTSNIKAKNLYVKLGYKDSGFGEFDSVWYETQNDGSKLKVIDHCVYLIKNLT